MNYDVVITCAITGAADAADEHPGLPVTPRENCRRNVRVGLEDNLYLSKGVHASNGQLVERAVTIIEAMGARVLTPQQAREKFQRTKRG